MTTPENIEDQTQKAQRLARLVYILIVITVVFFVTLMDLRPLEHTGILKYVAIGYFLSLVGVLVSSLTWLFRFGPLATNGTALSRTKKYMIAWMLISIVFVTASAFLLLVALTGGFLFDMI